MFTTILLVGLGLGLLFAVAKTGLPTALWRAFRSSSGKAADAVNDAALIQNWETDLKDKAEDLAAARRAQSECYATQQQPLRQRAAYQRYLDKYVAALQAATDPAVQSRYALSVHQAEQAVALWTKNAEAAAKALAASEAKTKALEAQIESDKVACKSAGVALTLNKIEERLNAKYATTDQPDYKAMVQAKLDAAEYLDRDPDADLKKADQDAAVADVLARYGKK